MMADQAPTHKAGGRARCLTVMLLVLALVLGSLAAVSLAPLPRAAAAPFWEGRKFAVLVAVEKYGWFPGPLNYCLDDLQDMKDVLVNDCGFTDVIELRDADATVSTVSDTLVRRLAPQVGPRDTVVFFFSGHGWPNLFGLARGSTCTTAFSSTGSSRRFFQTSKPEGWRCCSMPASATDSAMSREVSPAWPAPRAHHQVKDSHGS